MFALNCSSVLNSKFYVLYRNFYIQFRPIKLCVRPQANIWCQTFTTNHSLYEDLTCKDFKYDRNWIFTFLWSSGNAWLTRLFLRWKDPSLGIIVSCCSTDSSEMERLTAARKCKGWRRSHYLYLLRTACPGCPRSGCWGSPVSSWSPSPGPWRSGWTARTSSAPGTGSGADLS